MIEISTNHNNNTITKITNIVLTSLLGTAITAPLKFFHLKIVGGYSSSKTLVHCKECNDFVWSYNIIKHNDAMYVGKRVTSAYVLPSEQEKKNPMDLFSIG